MADTGDCDDCGLKSGGIMVIEKPKKPKVYYGSWDNYDGMKQDWATYNYGVEKDEDRYTPPDNFPPPESILFASYGGASYEGDALVLFERDGKLYEVQDSHCSCRGLEYWKPIEVTWPALMLRVEAEEKRMKEKDHYYHEILHDHDNEARKRFIALVKEHND